MVNEVEDLHYSLFNSDMVRRCFWKGKMGRRRGEGGFIGFGEGGGK